MPTPSDYASFLLRLWREDPGCGAPQEWHGEIEHIQTGQHWTFRSLNEVLAFLCRLEEDLGALEPPPVA